MSVQPPPQLAHLQASETWEDPQPDGEPDEVRAFCALVAVQPLACGVALGRVEVMAEA